MGNKLRALVAVLIVATLTGCASSIEGWILDTRVHQGDLALANGNPADAVSAYSLALKVDPHDIRAQSGFVEAAGDEAQAQYANGHFDAALATIAAGLRVDPLSVRLDALKTQIEDARLNQQIVISNYPTYQRAEQELEQSYARLADSNLLITKALRKFGYTYNVNDLSTAVKQSYELQLEVAHLTARLIAYRQLVQAGGGASTSLPPAGAGSLLPLP